MKVKRYKDLLVWRKAMELVEERYRVMGLFPRSEDFGLKAQMRCAAVSIPSNIAKGNVRHVSNDYCRFLAIARGSAAELETQIELARRLRFESASDAERFTLRCQEVGRMLNSLRVSIRNTHNRRSPNS